MDKEKCDIYIHTHTNTHTKWSTTQPFKKKDDLFPFGAPLKILLSPWAAAPPGVTSIVRTSRTQSPASAEVSLMLRSASLAWGVRRPKWMSSHSVATWCQMSMSSFPLKVRQASLSMLPGSLCVHPQPNLEVTALK